LRRHDRLEVGAGELHRLQAAARDSGRTFRGLSGSDRAYLHATACGTGFRASALASLTPESFDLAGALEKLPSVLPGDGPPSEALQGTGIDSAG
jgi:hypothetical protein